MVSLTLKVILHVAENDSKYRDVAPLRYSATTLTGYTQRFSTNYNTAPIEKDKDITDLIQYLLIGLLHEFLSIYFKPVLCVALDGPGLKQLHCKSYFIHETKAIGRTVEKMSFDQTEVWYVWLLFVHRGKMFQVDKQDDCVSSHYLAFSIQFYLNNRFIYFIYLFTPGAVSRTIQSTRVCKFDNR